MSISTDTMLQIAEIRNVFRILNRIYPHPQPPLKHQSAYELLVAVILSAQCTDERVNLVTPALFRKANTPQAMVALGVEGIKPLIHSCGFFNAKARSIHEMSTSLIADHNGHVPGTLEELIKLRGVGEKTASVVLAQWFHVPALPVDTHIFRVANRLGIVRANTPEKTYRALIAKVPKIYWIDGSLQLVFHGRRTCIARKPKCHACKLRHICEYPRKNVK